MLEINLTAFLDPVNDSHVVCTGHLLTLPLTVMRREAQTTSVEDTVKIADDKNNSHCALLDPARKESCVKPVRNFC